jgi:hypothetical protein
LRHAASFVRLAAVPGRALAEVEVVADPALEPELELEPQAAIARHVASTMPTPARLRGAPWMVFTF